MNGVCSNDKIQIGDTAQETVPLLLGNAACYADDGPPPLFQMPESPKRAVNLLLGLFPDAAGIDKDEVSLVGFFCLDVTAGPQKPEYPLRIMLIHLAAIGFDVDTLFHR